MSEEKTPRTLDTIRQEYSSLCARAGHTQYQIATLESDLKLINSQLRDLNLEASSVQASQPTSTEVK